MSGFYSTDDLKPHSKILAGLPAYPPAHERSHTTQPAPPIPQIQMRTSHRLPPLSLC